MFLSDSNFGTNSRITLAILVSLKSEMIFAYVTGTKTLANTTVD